MVLAQVAIKNSELYAVILHKSTTGAWYLISETFLYLSGVIYLIGRCLIGEVLQYYWPLKMALPDLISVFINSVYC